jgi:hypothetical protein
MTVVTAKIEAARIAHETTFGADLTATLNVFKYLPFREGTSKLTLTKPKESPMHVQQRVDGHPLRVTMPKSAVWEFEINGSTITTKAASTIAATQSPLGMILETYLGGKNLATGTTINDAGADQNDWDATVVTTLRPGGVVGLTRATDGVLEVRGIKSKTGSNIVLKHNTTPSPANGATVYAAATYFANPLTTGAEFKSLQLVAEGYQTTDKYVCRGGAVTGCELTLEPGQIPRLKFTVTFATWDYADGAAVVTDLNGSTLSAATYVDSEPLVFADSEFMVGVVGTAALHSRPNISAIAPTLAISFQAVRTPGGVMNIAQFVRVHVSPLGELKFTMPYEDQTWFDIRDNDTILSALLQIGSAPSRGALVFDWPNLQVIDVQRVEIDGIAGHEVTAVPRHDTDTTAESGYEGLAGSAFRIHQL